MLNNLDTQVGLKPKNEQFINVNEKTSFIIFIVFITVMILFFLLCIIRLIFYKKAWWFCDLISKIKY